MASVEGIRIQNFKALKDVTLGKLWSTPNNHVLSPLTVIIGRNGVGKTSLFDVFGFLADCLRFGVEEASDLNDRGGFEKLRTKGVSDPIKFEIYYRQTIKSRPITYEVEFDVEKNGRPFVLSERIRQQWVREADTKFSFLYLKAGVGVVWTEDWINTSESEVSAFETSLDKRMNLINNPLEGLGRTKIELADKKTLGIATLGALKEHPNIAAFRQFIEGWYLSYFMPDAARTVGKSGPQARLNVHGDNLGNVVQFFERSHPELFKRILAKIAKKIPGITAISTAKTEDGRLVLRFNDGAFKDPFQASEMSDGTLKLFAYLLMLEDPTPPPLICIEEPENGLYHRLLTTLVQEFRSHAERNHKFSSQVLITTHQPYLVDALSPEEVWVMAKGKDGYAKITRASDDPKIVALVEEGLPLGSLWFSEYLDAE